MRMKDFGVMVEVDDYGWPVFPIDEIPFTEPAAGAAPENPNTLPPLDKEAAAAALTGFTAAMTDAHTANKITRVWNKWENMIAQCDKLMQAEFLRVRAEAMARVKATAQLQAAE